MFCNQCGKFNSPENEFCYYCGSPLMQPVTTPPDTPVMVGAELTATAIGRIDNPKDEEPSAEMETAKKEDISKQDADKKAPEKENIPDQEADKKAPEKEDLPDQEADKKTPEKEDLPDQEADKKAPEEETIPDQEADKKAPEKEDLPDQDADKKTPEKEDLSNQEAEEKAPEFPGAHMQDAGEEQNETADAQIQNAEEKAAGSKIEPADEYPESEQISREPSSQEKTRSGRGQKIFMILELIILAAAAGTLGYLLHRNYGPEQDVRTYLCSKLTGDWEKAYSYLDIREDTSGLLSVDMYEKVMEQTPSKGFSDLSLTEVTDPAVLSVEAGIQEDLTSGEKAYKAVYYDLDDEEQKSEYILMEKTDETYGLIFHRWKVNVSDLCVSDLTVTVHEGAALTLNGCMISVDPEENPDNTTDTYTLDQLFKGNYTADLTMENGESGSEELQIESSDAAINLSEAELYPDQELMDQVLDQFIADYQAILSASLNGVDFAEIQNYFAENAISEGRAQAMYENACSQAFTEEKGAGILKIELSDISAEYVSWKKSNYASAGDLVMEVSTTMSYTYTEDGGQTQKSDVQNSVGLLCYHQENGQWKIQSFS